MIKQGVTPLEDSSWQDELAKLKNSNNQPPKKNYQVDSSSSESNSDVEEEIKDDCQSDKESDNDIPN